LDSDEEDSEEEADKTLIDIGSDSELPVLKK